MLTLDSSRPHPPVLLLLLLLLLLGRATASSAAAGASNGEGDAALASALAYATADNATYVTDLMQLARIASISALPEHAADVQQAAEWLVARLRSAGLENVQQMPPAQGAQPVVYGDWLHAGADKPTVLVYGHYDVQPVDPLDLWESPPFEPQERGGFFYGRGVDDDKSGLLQPIQAVEAFLHTGDKLPVNVKFLLEGQEEIGSPHLPDFLSTHAQGLFAGIDLVLNADGGQVSATQPGICTGLRGAAALEVTVTTAGSDMHSGMVGGSVQNANHALLQLLSGLWDRGSKAGSLLGLGSSKASHRVTVPGFYDDVNAMAAEDKADVAAFPFDEEAEASVLGVLGFMGEAGYGTLERRWYRPTLEIVGMTGGFTGAGIKTVIPRTASAKISCRLVPDQRPDDITAKVAAALRAAAPPMTNVSVQVLGFRANPWVSPKDTPGNRLAAGVLQDVYGVAPVFYRGGATIPALAYFDSILGVPTTGFGFGLGDHIHAPNERTPVQQYHVGRVAWVRMLAVLGHKLPAKARGAHRYSGGHSSSYLTFGTADPSGLTQKGGAGAGEKVEL